MVTLKLNDIKIQISRKKNTKSEWCKSKETGIGNKEGRKD